VIEKPLPLPESNVGSRGRARRPGVEPTLAREEAVSYGDGAATTSDLQEFVMKDAPDDRSRDHLRSRDHDEDVSPPRPGNPQYIHP
jgi:hypothetical protein